MRVAIVGVPPTENIETVILKYLPKTTTELWCSEEDAGAVASLAAALRVAFRAVAPMQEGELLEHTDEVLVFWSGEPDRAGRLAAKCVKLGRPVRLIPLSLL